MKNNLVFLKILDFFSRKSKVWLSLSFYSDYKTLHQVTEPLLSNVTYELSLVLRPELRTANCAFPASGEKAVEMLEKVLRAVMLRLMVQLLQGYRSCLTLVRIHPEPYITFDKSAFLGLWSLSQDCDFILHFLDCMFFNEFISARGRLGESATLLTNFTQILVNRCF